MNQVTGPDGKQYETQAVEVLDSKELWSEYVLSDGSVVRVKQVLTEIKRVKDQYDQFGNPVYIISAQPVVSVKATGEDESGRHE